MSRIDSRGVDLAPFTAYKGFLRRRFTDIYMLSPILPWKGPFWTRETDFSTTPRVGPEGLAAGGFHSFLTEEDARAFMSEVSVPGYKEVHKVLAWGLSFHYTWNGRPGWVTQFCRIPYREVKR